MAKMKRTPNRKEKEVKFRKTYLEPGDLFTLCRLDK